VRAADAALIAALLKDEASLVHDLDLLGPEELTSAFTLGISLAELQGMIIQRRLEEIQAGGLSGQGSGPGGPNGGVDGKGDKNVLLPPDLRWGTFITGAGEFTSLGNHDSNARGYDLNSGGFTLGVDYKFTPHLAIGFLAGYTGSAIDLSGGGRLFANTGTVGLYGTYFDGGFYVDTAVAGAYNSYDSRRAAFGGDARGDFDGGQLNVLFATGYNWKMGGFSIGPTGVFQYVHINTDGFTEHGSVAPLSLNSQSADSLTTSFGMKASYDWKLSNGVVIRPELRAAWRHEFGDRSFEETAALASDSSTNFTVQGPQIGRDSLLIGAGFSIQWSERVSTYLYYDGELGRENYSSHNVTGGIRVSF
jgi:outer membrane autotransporter protein